MSLYERLLEWLKTHKKDLVLGLLFFLVSSTSFSLGYLAANEVQHGQIIVSQQASPIASSTPIAKPKVASAKATASVIDQVNAALNDPQAQVSVEQPVITPQVTVEPASTPAPIVAPQSQPEPSPTYVPPPAPQPAPAPTPVISQPQTTPQQTPTYVPPPSGCQPGQININTASLTELDAIKHVGPATAAKIVAARPFASLEELAIKVSGIGDKILTDIKAEGKACVQ